MTFDKAANGSRHGDPSGREVVIFEDGSRDFAKRAAYVDVLDSPRRAENSNGLLDLWHLLRNHWVVVLLTGVLGAVSGGLLTMYQTPEFRAKATVEVQPQSPTVLGYAAMQIPEAGGPDSYVRTQVKILLSQTLQDRVLAKLAATNKLSSSAPPDRLAPIRKLLHIPGGGQAAQSKARVPAFDFKVAYDTTNIIELSCESPDPAFAANFVNTMADEYTKKQLETRLENSERSATFLTGQLASMKAKLEAGEQQLRGYSVASNILPTDAQDAIPEEKLKEVQRELSTASADRIHAQSLYEVAARTSQDSVPMVADNERLSGYQSDMAKLQQQLAEKQALFTDEHPEVVRLKAQIAELQTTLTRERSAVITRIHNDYLAAQRREALLQEAYINQNKVVSDHASRFATYDVLKREVDTDRELYSALLQKVREAGVASAFSSNNVNVVDPATVPTKPFRPSMGINVAGGLLGALLLGIGLVIVGDQVNRSLKSPGETTLHLRVPELGVIPAYEGSSGLQQQGTSTLILGPEENGKKSGELIELAMRNDAQSLVAESYRNVLTSILLSDSSEGRPKVIVVTAAGHQAGKSTSVSNLALALAEIGQKVLVIDADMRRPKQHLIFDTSNSWGLSDLLRERTSLKDCPLEAIARPLECGNLYLLPSGPACANISSLLYSNRVGDLFQRVRREFDTILIDSPPVLMVSDARVIGRLADAAILVICSGETTRDTAFQAKQRLVDDGIPVLGTILNRWRLKGKSKYVNYNYRPQTEV